MKECATNPYVALMYGEFKDWTFDEKACEHKGLWRKNIFNVDAKIPVDLEIGTGNGTHFAQISNHYPQRCFLGLELKFKTLVQSIRRTLNDGATNARMLRFRAEGVKELFNNQEIDNVYIHFPDPWPKKRHHKNRLIQTRFLSDLYEVMRPDSFIEFKTDDHNYFRWAMQFFNKSPFLIQFYSEDLHSSAMAEQNFVTHFESLFLKKQQPIYYCRLIKQSF